MKRLLVINFFPAFVPPSSGGELRYFNLYQRLSRHFDVTLLSPTYSHHANEVVTHSPSFRERRIPKQPLHDHIHMQIAEEKIADEISALVCSYSARVPNNFHLAYLELQAEADVIVHESPYMLEYDLLLGLDDRPRIYNSYNVESDLVSQVWKGPNAQKHLEHITSLERRLLQSTPCCFSVSDAEAALFASKFDLPPSKFRLVENGVEASEFLPRHELAGEKPVALFFGSFHPPNAEAAQFIINVLAPACPDIVFQIAGSCLAQGAGPLPQNVQVLGRVDNKTRLELFSRANVAINPMLSGSGTNLKALEFLAAGLPMVATPIGARGLALVDGQHALIADKSSFALRLAEFMHQDSVNRNAMAARGRNHVIELFSWDAIATRAADAISSTIEQWLPERRRKVLVLNDFSVSRPAGGGEIRINRIYSHLSASCDVTLACLTEANEVSRAHITEHFAEIRIPKTQEHRQRNADLERQWHMSAADIVSYLEAPNNPLLLALVRALAKRCNVVVLSHPYMVTLLDGLSSPPVIYESHNVETDLKRGTLLGHPAYAMLMNAVESCEHSAIAKSAHIVLVSETDRKRVQSLANNCVEMTVVANGVDVPERRREPGALDWIRDELLGRPLLIFVGSAHPPNVEAAAYIRDVLAHQLPDCVIGIIGSVCGAIPQDHPKNMILFGVLDEDAKNLIVEMADLAINPMQSGSGSNLKLADYFSKSLATVTTEFGARGYTITNGEEAVICPLSSFAAEINSLLEHKDRIRKIGDRAFDFAKKHLDWSLQADRFRGVLDLVCNPAPKKRLLIITFRFSDPPMGGAETYLLELVRQLSNSGKFSIDVATLDSTEITNEFHFSAVYGNSKGARLPLELPNVSVMRFAPDAIPSAQRLEASRRIYSAWMDESRSRSTLCIDKLPDTILLGGWFFPERTATGTEIWSSQIAFVRAKNVERMSLAGHSPMANILEVWGSNRKLVEFNVSGDFTVEFALNRQEIVELRMARFFAPSEDPRELGVKFRQITTTLKGASTVLDLNVSNKDILRHAAADALIDSFISAAQSRAPELDDLFQRIRGPKSQSMEKWLSENAKQYVAIVGHAAPFSTIVTAAEHASAARVPVIQIPHIHIDDEFYHWRKYYDALRNAEVSLVHPRASIPLFFNKIGARAEYLAFGIDASESPSPADEAEFKRLYPSSLPFFLVLGRKDAAKNYQLTIDAIRRVNEGSRVCNLVMIGRDEDQIPLREEEVIYLGSQPRGVVLAALRRTLAVVTMSDSESFGIVILEAWGQGAAVIANERCHASLELVDDGQTGLLASPHNLDKVAMRLLANPELARSLGAHGREVTIANFSWNVIGGRLIELIDAVSKKINARK
jgi:glycosyltransferase involved in cell wall biosynthesis